MDTITSIKGETGRDARRRIRAGAFRQPTSGMAPGYVQGNLAILPKELTADFARFCMLNPKPCPLLGQSVAFYHWAIVLGCTAVGWLFALVVMRNYRARVAYWV